MMRSTKIDYYVNADHERSGLPPVHTEYVIIESDTIIGLSEQADKHRELFRKEYGLPDAIGCTDWCKI